MGYSCRWQGIGRNYEKAKSEVIGAQNNIYELFRIEQSEEHKVKYNVFKDGDIVAFVAHMMSYGYVWLNGWDKDESVYVNRSECDDDPFLFKPRTATLLV